MAQHRPLFNKIHIFFHKSGVGAWVTFMTEFSDFRSSRLSDVGVEGACGFAGEGREKLDAGGVFAPRILVPALGALARASLPSDSLRVSVLIFIYLRSV